MLSRPMTIVRYETGANEWKRAKTALKHGIRFAAEKTDQEHEKSAFGGGGKAEFTTPCVTQLKNRPVFEPRRVISAYHKRFRQTPKNVPP